MTNLRLNDRHIDIWYVRSEPVVADAPLVQEYRARLPRDEVEQADRFVFEPSRMEHVIARMLVRTALSHYTGHELAVWRFAPGAFGKPAVAEPAGVLLEFNLSHAAGLIVCAVTAGPDVGIDTEHLNRKANHLMLAKRYFAPSESALVEQAPPHEQRRLFLRLWTLKEAFIKAKGLGLSIPLADVEFSLADNRAPRVRFVEGINESPEDWQFAELPIVASHQVAMATQIPLAQKAFVQVRETIPLRWQVVRQGEQLLTGTGFFPK